MNSTKLFERVCSAKLPVVLSGLSTRKQGLKQHDMYLKYSSRYNNRVIDLVQELIVVWPPHWRWTCKLVRQ